MGHMNHYDFVGKFCVTWIQIDFELVTHHEIQYFFKWKNKGYNTNQHC
jgi:hypothetical protein